MNGARCPSHSRRRKSGCLGLRGGLISCDNRPTVPVAPRLLGHVLVYYTDRARADAFSAGQWFSSGLDAVYLTGDSYETTARRSAAAGTSRSAGASAQNEIAGCCVNGRACAADRSPGERPASGKARAENSLAERRAADGDLPSALSITCIHRRKGTCWRRSNAKIAQHRREESRVQKIPELEADGRASNPLQQTELRTIW